MFICDHFYELFSDGNLKDLVSPWKDLVSSANIISPQMIFHGREIPPMYVLLESRYITLKNTFPPLSSEGFVCVPLSNATISS